jgi:hypothetical protein
LWTGARRSRIASKAASPAIDLAPSVDTFVQWLGRDASGEIDQVRGFLEYERDDRHASGTPPMDAVAKSQQRVAG